MKRLVLFSTLILSTTSFAEDIQFENLTKSDIEKVSREFTANFSHTGVSAPETNGSWGLEVGIIASQTKSPDLSSVVDKSGGKGSDFENLYQAGIQGRIHLPFELFAEVTLLPEQELSDVKLKNTTYEVGWNFGRVLGLPIDLAFAVNRADSGFNFSQSPSLGTQAKVDFESQTTIMWVGVSKKILFITPYAKFGKANSEASLDSSADIFGFPGPTSSYDVENEGNYFAFGANLELGLLKFSAEISKIMDVERMSGKFSIDI